MAAPASHCSQSAAARVQTRVHMAEQLITRRGAFKYLGLLTATAAGREFLANWLPSAVSLSGASRSGDLVSMPGMHHGPPPPQPAEPYSPQFFKPDEFETVEILTEMIIPTDEKPGAKEAQVANYIDFVVFSAAEFEPSLQREWNEGLAWLDRESKRRHNAPFREIAASERERVITEMSLPERDSTVPQTHPGFGFYKLIKGMTVEGFYTSRIGLIDVLEYQGLTY